MFGGHRYFVGLTINLYGKFYETINESKIHT